ncbi:MAG: hypothetical protein JWM57_854 [Phycisphaerales bacterium]|nr:hypothetical protein [Phycisphaerales bacterium]
MVAGVLHFARPAMYERIIPPSLPWPAALVYLSGWAEIAGGVGLLIPRLRRAAGLGLVALLIAVFPANIYMAVHADRFADPHLPAWALWLRLPLQFALIAWVLRVARPVATQSSSSQ